MVQTRLKFNKTLSNDTLETLETLAKSSPRQCLAYLFLTEAYGFVIVAISIVNLALVIAEIDCHASNSTIPVWIKAGTFTFMGLFTLEVLARFYAFRFKSFKDTFFMLEVFVLVVEFGSLAFRHASANSLGLSVMRVLRLVKLTRSSFVFMYCPELRMIVRSLVGAAKPLFWGAFMLGFIFILLGILAVQVIHPLNEEVTRASGYQDCQRCPRAFGSVWQAVITLFQGCIAGDSWGEVAIPIIEMYPLTGVYFGAAFTIIAIAVMNVMLASVVDSATQARLENDRYVADQKTRERARLQRQCHTICTQMDKDSNGFLTMEELIDGYRNNRRFHHLLKAMDVHEEDLETVFCVMDEDESGTVDYLEFTEQLFKMKASDTHTMILFLKHHVARISKETKESLAIMKNELVTGMRRSLQMEEKALNMLRDEEVEIHKIINLEVEDSRKLSKLTDMVTEELGPGRIHEHSKPIPDVQLSNELKPFPNMSPSRSFNELLTVPISNPETLQKPQMLSTDGARLASDSISAPIAEAPADICATHEVILKIEQSLRRLEERISPFATPSSPGDILPLIVEPKMAHPTKEPTWHLPCCLPNTTVVARVV